LTELATAALLLLLGGAATSVILALPVAVAAESLTNASLAVARRFWIIVNILPLAAGCLLMAAGFLFQYGDITATPHQERVRAHLCLLRFTSLPDAPFRSHLCAIAALALILYALVRFVLSLRASRRAERIARLLADGDTDEAPLVVLPVEEPDCFSLGLNRPVMLMTEGLTQLLTAAEAEAVLAHERCHVRHRDNWLELLMRLATDALVWVPSTHYYLRSLRSTLEQSCDRAGAEATSAEALASALGKLEAAKKAQQLKLQGDLASLRPLFPSHANPAGRLAVLLGERYVSLALPLPVIAGLELAVLAACALWFSRPLHDTLYCATKSLLAVLNQ
jgi:Zn-dependent protease with chaperone function